MARPHRVPVPTGGWTRIYSPAPTRGPHATIGVRRSLKSQSGELLFVSAPWDKINRHPWRTPSKSGRSAADGFPLRVDEAIYVDRFVPGDSALDTMRGRAP